MKLVIGITGSTGVIYGIRMLETLKKLNVETHLVMSEWAEKCISMETEHTIDYVKSLATNISDEKNMASSVSSGTHRIDGMIVAPCSMKTLSAIANGYDDTLVARAAGVTIKESRKLILMVRETPLSAIHLENMLKLSRLGVVILPPVTEFYTKPKSIDDIINHGVGKCLDQFDIDHNLSPRWGTVWVNVPKFFLEQVSTAKRKSVFDILSNFRDYQKLLPQHFPSVRIRSVRETTSVVEEHMVLGGKELVIMAKHVIDEPLLHEIFVIGGDAKGSYIKQQILDHSKGCKILVDVDLKLPGIMKLSGLFNTAKFKENYAKILDDFIKIVEI